MDDWDPIPLSRLSHAGFCLRRAALLTNEQIWAENADTARGRTEHEKVHTQRIERRRNSAKLYEFPVFSRSLGVSGKCDCIEVQANENGCMISAVDFPAVLFPVEYKHGKLRTEEEYEIQLCAQAMCLEEMFKTQIPAGAIYYISSHRRYPVSFSENLRALVVDTIQKIEDFRRTFTIPPAEYSPKCRSCSLREQCMPSTLKSAKKYCEQLCNEAKEVDSL